MITVTRIDAAGSAHRVTIREHELVVDLTPPPGGTSAGPDPHDLYDAALGACKALTVLWQAQRKGVALTGIDVAVSRDASAERSGHYRLRTVLTLDGDLSEADRAMLFAAAERCPVHRLMTEVETHIDTVLADG